MTDDFDPAVMDTARQQATELVLACRTSEERLNRLIGGVEEQVRTRDVDGISALVGTLVGIAAQLMREASDADDGTPPSANRRERRRRRRAR